MKNSLIWIFGVFAGIPLWAQPFTADLPAVNQSREEHTQLYEQFPPPPNRCAVDGAGSPFHLCPPGST